MERLVFGYGTSGHGREAPSRPAVRAAADDRPPAEENPRRAAERFDWAFVGLMVFTGLLFFRPQDMLTPLRMLHLAELAAIFALGALLIGRLSRGLAVSRVTPELVGVFAFAGVMLMTAPFSIWMGGVIGTFTDMYAKVILIFLLMVNTLTSPRRIEQFTWLLVIASGYIAGRAVLDYARGINLIENGRVQGAVGGMFRNPNDLALNMVSILPLALLLALRPYSVTRRAVAALAGLLMLAAVVFTHSRSGFLSLAVILVVLAIFLMRRRPGLVFAGALAAVLAVPALPPSYIQRIASITNEELDETGSREARSILLREAYDVFKAHPLTGVGAGQFKNYDPDGREEAWRETHNVVLQVGSELGVFGLLVWGFLIVRATAAPIQTRNLLGRLTRGPRGSSARTSNPLPPAEVEMLRNHSIAIGAGLLGWFVSALFGSVAYHWTFYYLLALATTPREYLYDRMTAARVPHRFLARTPDAVGAHV